MGGQPHFRRKCISWPREPAVEAARWAAVPAEPSFSKNWPAAFPKEMHKLATRAGSAKARWAFARRSQPFQKTGQPHFRRKCISWPREPDQRKPGGLSPGGASLFKKLASRMPTKNTATHTIPLTFPDFPAKNASSSCSNAVLEALFVFLPQKVPPTGLTHPRRRHLSRQFPQ